MGCPKVIAEPIVAKKANYVLQVKDNQPTLREAISAAFIRFADDGYTEPSLRRWRTIDRDHGREEPREYFIADLPADCGNPGFRRHNALSDRPIGQIAASNGENRQNRNRTDGGGLYHLGVWSGERIRTGRHERVARS